MEAELRLIREPHRPPLRTPKRKHQPGGFRLFAFERQKIGMLVCFYSGRPFPLPNPSSRGNSREGFLERMDLQHDPTSRQSKGGSRGSPFRPPVYRGSDRLCAVPAVALAVGPRGGPGVTGLAVRPPVRPPVRPHAPRTAGRSGGSNAGPTKGDYGGSWV